MPDLPYSPRRLATARKVLSDTIYWVQTSGGATVLVGAVAAILWFFRVEFQFVAGGFLIVFAYRLSQKRLYPEITVPSASRTPVRDRLEKPRDPFESLTGADTQPPRQAGDY